jgi:hypothetical protein
VGWCGIENALFRAFSKKTPTDHGPRTAARYDRATLKSGGGYAFE